MTFNIGDMVQVHSIDNSLINGDVGFIKSCLIDSVIFEKSYYVVGFGVNSKVCGAYGLETLHLYPELLRPYHKELQYDPAQQGDLEEDI